MTRVRHLAWRFLGALRPWPPRAADSAWVASVLGPDEHALWRRMPNHDRRHSIAVARRVERSLGGSPHDGDTRWVAAALLHDVGKLDAGLGVFGRVGATIAGALAGHDMAEAWSAKRGITRRVGLYLRHPELGAERIRVAGGDEESACWAAAHHTPADWSSLPIPNDVVSALHAADND